MQPMVNPMNLSDFGNQVNIRQVRSINGNPAGLIPYIKKKSVVLPIQVLTLMLLLYD